MSVKCMDTILRHGVTHGVPITEDSNPAFCDLGKVLYVPTDCTPTKTYETSEEPVKVDRGVDCDGLECETNYSTR